MGSNTRWSDLSYPHIRLARMDQRTSLTMKCIDSVSRRISICPRPLNGYKKQLVWGEDGCLSHIRRRIADGYATMILNHLIHSVKTLSPLDIIGLEDERRLLQTGWDTTCLWCIWPRTYYDDSYVSDSCIVTYFLILTYFSWALGRKVIAQGSLWEGARYPRFFRLHDRRMMSRCRDELRVVWTVFKMNACQYDLFNRAISQHIFLHPAILWRGIILRCSITHSLKMTDAQKYVALHTHVRRIFHDIWRYILKITIYWFTPSKQTVRWKSVTTRSKNILDDILLFFFRLSYKILSTWTAFEISKRIVIISTWYFSKVSWQVSSFGSSDWYSVSSILTPQK